MDIDDTIARVKQLIAQRESINAELAAIFAGTAATTRKPITCGHCGKEGHTARTCPEKQGQGEQS
jgi:Zinc knuckle.